MIDPACPTHSTYTVKTAPTTTNNVDTCFLATENGVKWAIEVFGCKNVVDSQQLRDF